MSVDTSFSSDALAARCVADGEFRLAARHWRGGLRLENGKLLAAITVAGGAVRVGDPGRDAPGVITLAGAPGVWAQLLAGRPQRFCNDIANLIGAGQIELHADPVGYAQYYPAIIS